MLAKRRWMVLRRIGERIGVLASCVARIIAGRGIIFAFWRVGSINWKDKVVIRWSCESGDLLITQMSLRLGYGSGRQSDEG